MARARSSLAARSSADIEASLARIAWTLSEFVFAVSVLDAPESAPWAPPGPLAAAPLKDADMSRVRDLTSAGTTVGPELAAEFDFGD